MSQTNVVVPVLNKSAPTRSSGRDGSVTNGRVVRAAQRRLHTSHYCALRCVACEYRDGQLLLRGEVPSFYLKQLAQETVRGIDGVEAIVNVLEVPDHRSVRS